MKKYLFLILSLLSGSAFCETVVIDRIVAKVNRDFITESQLSEQLHLAQKTLAAQKISSQSETELKKEVLQFMISQSLQLQFANQMGIRVTPEEVDQTIHQIASQQQLSVEAFLQKLPENGLTVASFRQNLSNQLILNKVQQNVISSQIHISPAEVATYHRSFPSEGTEQEIAEKLFKKAFEEKLTAWDNQLRHTNYVESLFSPDEMG